MRSLSFMVAYAVLLTGFTSNANAQDAALRDDYAAACQLTPAISSNAFPGKSNITSYNNLAQPEGKAQQAAGQFVYLTGRVLDARCVPLSQARVEIWQANIDGKYVYPDRGSFANPYPLFAGTGATLTDGEGRFAFYTLFPGVTGAKAAPQIHLHITHPNTKDLFTTLFFSGEARNITDPTLSRLKEALRALVIGKVEPFTHTDGSLALHIHQDITVAGSDPFRRF